jgi:hypothetical protein
VVNSPLRICIFFLTLFGVAQLHAKELTDYRVGDIADRDIVAPAAFDAIDSAATAEKKIEAAKKIPVIFRDFSNSATNAVVTDFSAAFARNRASFIAALQKRFHSSELRDRIITSKTFDNFVATYNLESENFPVSETLAADWARGESGNEIQNQLLDRLLEILQNPICAEPLPQNFSSAALCLVSVDRLDESISVASISEKNKIVAATNLLTLTTARENFRKKFPTNELALVSASAHFLKPNCAPDLALTQQFRDRATRDSTVALHFATGQIVIPRGSIIDEKMKSILAQMPSVISQASVQNTFPASTASPISNAAFNHELWLVSALVAVSAVAITALFFVLRMSRMRPAESQLPVRMPAPGYFSPQIAEVIKAALVQELAATRVELFKAQQNFTAKMISANGHESRNGKALTTDSESHFVENLIQEGQSRLTANEFEKALKCFDTALTLRPADAETLVKMGGVLEKLDRIEEAFACYDRAIAADNQLTVAYLQKGGLLNRLARYAEATQCYEKALTNQKKNSSETDLHDLR